MTGFPEEERDFAQLDRLKGLPVNLIVGDGDLYWKNGMKSTRQKLTELGIPVRMVIVPRNGHLLPDMNYEKPVGF